MCGIRPELLLQLLGVPLVVPKQDGCSGRLGVSDWSQISSGGHIPGLPAASAPSPPPFAAFPGSRERCEPCRTRRTASSEALLVVSYGSRMTELRAPSTSGLVTSKTSSSGSERESSARQLTSPPTFQRTNAARPAVKRLTHYLHPRRQSPRPRNRNTRRLPHPTTSSPLPADQVRYYRPRPPRLLVMKRVCEVALLLPRACISCAVSQPR